MALKALINPSAGKALVNPSTGKALLKYTTDPVTEIKDGYLYNWYAASDANMFPTDWRLPTEDDWDLLVSNLGGDTVAGGVLKENSLDYWDSPNTDASDGYGFAFRGVGCRTVVSSTTEFLYQGEYGFISLGTYNSATVFGYAYTSYDSAICGKANGFGEGAGLPIRAVYEGTGKPPDQITDFDGSVYEVIEIEGQYWTKRNWKCTHLNDGTEIPYVTDDVDWLLAQTNQTKARCAYDNDINNV